MHSFSQYVLLPWAYTSLESPPDYDYLKQLGDKGAMALKAVHGKTYEVYFIIILIEP